MTAAPKEASKLGQFSWALFDWANQPFFTIITTFIFAPYFANVLVGDPVKGQSAWAFTQSTSGILIALMSPFLGAMADAGGRRKPYIFAFQLLLAAGCAGLWWAYPDRPDLIMPISWAVIAATVGAEMSIVFNNAQLPNIVRPQRMGWLSGFGWGLGYCGGLISLFIVLAVSMPSMFGLGTGDQPLFGLDPKTHELERLVGPASALWLAVFVLPMFLFTPDSAGARRQSLWVAAKQGGASLVSTVRKLSHFRNALTYLIAFMLYNDGLAAIIAFGGVYAAATFGWSTVTLGIFGIILTVFAIPGAFLGGRLDDMIGSKRTVQIAIAGVIIATLGIVGVTADRVFYFIPADPLSPTRGLFGSLQEKTLMGFALILGFCMGPMQAASRTMIGRIAPEGMTGEFYGLFALSGRATAWMAPLAIGIVTAASGSTRIGMACVLAFLMLGFILLWSVREERAKH
ncbi:MFS transporter [Reyranella sp.]|uniref:MFS transporter n=1 Tax=Reyranella sp. TaxID=1929291 RepID=UPI001205A05D|nr:MFS transporter [Reyranella sp.]TAJ81645.1 MAG: MFS transporter [Reyranella sp.]